MYFPRYSIGVTLTASSNRHQEVNQPTYLRHPQKDAGLASITQYLTIPTLCFLRQRALSPILQGPNSGTGGFRLALSKCSCALVFCRLPSNPVLHVLRDRHFLFSFDQGAGCGSHPNAVLISRARFVARRFTPARRAVVTHRVTKRVCWNRVMLNDSNTVIRPRDLTSVLWGINPVAGTRGKESLSSRSSRTKSSIP